MVDYFIQKATDFVIVHWKKLLYLSAALFVVIVGLRFLSSIALIEVEVDTTPTGSKEVPRVFANTATTSREIGKPGMHIISRDTKSILATTENNIRTQSMINIPWFGYLRKKITLHRDKNADKVAFNSTLDNVCAAFSKKNDRLMQYDCDKPQSLVYYNTPRDKEWAVETIIDGISYSPSTITPYSGGVIGIAQRNDTDVEIPGSIISIDESGDIHPHLQPEHTDSSTFGSVKIFTDMQDQTNNRFVIVEQNGTIHLSTPNQDPKKPQVSYTTIAAPQHYDSSLQQTICSLRDAAVTCYRGLATNIGDTTDDTDKIQPQIIQLNFGSDKAVTTDIKDRSLFFDFAVTNDGQLYGLSFKKLVRFAKEGDIYTTQELSQNVDAIAGSDKLYFLQRDGVFTIDPSSHDAYQVFYSHNIKPEKLMAASDKVFIIGKSVNNTGNTYAWQLNDNDDVNYSNRLIDILPSFPASRAYGTTDLVGNMIHIQITVNRSDSAADVRRKKQATIDYLKDLGVNTDQVIISSF